MYYRTVDSVNMNFKERVEDAQRLLRKFSESPSAGEIILQLRRSCRSGHGEMPTESFNSYGKFDKESDSDLKLQIRDG